MDRSFFSFIVPVYMTEELFLKKCIDSILAQTYTRFELILIDDGSPDNCGIICDKYGAADSRVHVYHTENNGVASARNFGISKAKGDWVLFVDSDDWVEINLLDTILINTDRDIDILVWNSYRNDKNIRIKNPYFGEDERLFIGKEKEILQAQAVWKYLLRCYPKYNTVATPWGKAYRRTLFDNEYAKFPVGMKICEDTIFNTYMFEYAKSVKYISKYLYNYRVITDSASNKQRAPAQEIEIKKRISDEVRLFMDRFNENDICMKGYYGRLLDELYTIYTIKMPGSFSLRRLCRGERYGDMMKGINESYVPERMLLFLNLIQRRKYLWLSCRIRLVKLKRKVRDLL